MVLQSTAITTDPAPISAAPMTTDQDNGGSEHRIPEAAPACGLEPHYQSIVPAGLQWQNQPVGRNKPRSGGSA